MILLYFSLNAFVINLYQKNQFNIKPDKMDTSYRKKANMYARHEFPSFDEGKIFNNKI